MAQLPTHVQEYIYSVGIVDYFSGRGPLPEGCKLYETRAAARTASGVAAWAGARGYAWEDARDGAWTAADIAAGVAARGHARGHARDAMRDAAGDAALAAECLLMRDHIAPEHLAYALMRWAIWVAGYGVAVEVDGVHYCYRRP